MPTPIPMAQTADLAGAWLGGRKIQADLQEAKDRLAQHAADTSARLRAAAEENAKQAQVEQQRIRVTEAYQQQQVGLRKRQLDEAEQMNAQKTQAAARQFEAKQQWQKGFDEIDANAGLTAEQKDAEKTKFTMRMAPMMGIPGVEASSMLRELRPEKPTVPASVVDKGEFRLITQPSGAISVQNKPRATARETDANVKVILEQGSAPVTMSKSQAMRVIPTLPSALQDDPVNMAVMPRRMGFSETIQEMQKAMPQGGGNGTPNAPGGRVKVFDKDGNPGTIDADKLEAALKKGYKRRE